VLRGRFGVLVGVVALMAGSAAPVSAEPVLSDGAVAPVESAAATVATAAPPTDDGAIESAPAASSVAPDGWTLTVGANHEPLKVVHPLTTALSWRDYEVSAVFNGSLRGP
jgi:hypothetical protein